MSVTSRHSGSYTHADCPTCSEMCDEDDTNGPAHRRWARRHVEQNPTHRAHLTTNSVRVYSDPGATR